MFRLPPALPPPPLKAEGILPPSFSFTAAEVLHHRRRGQEELLGGLPFPTLPLKLGFPPFFSLLSLNRRGRKEEKKKKIFPINGGGGHCFLSPLRSPTNTFPYFPSVRFSPPLPFYLPFSPTLLFPNWTFEGASFPFSPCYHYSSPPLPFSPEGFLVYCLSIYPTPPPTSNLLTPHSSLLRWWRKKGRGEEMWSPL